MVYRCALSFFLSLLALFAPLYAIAHPVGAGGSSRLELHDWGHKLPALIAVVAIVVVIDSIFLRLILRPRGATEEGED